MATQTYLSGSIANLLTTELNSLANNGLAVGAEYTAGGGYLLAELELVVSYGTAPTANTGVAVWLLRAIDATPNYEDGSTSITPARAPDAVFPLRAVTGAQRIIRRVAIPPGNWKALLKNDGAGQALAASGNTLKILPLTYQQ
jgi:hypothetical protein